MIASSPDEREKEMNRVSGETPRSARRRDWLLLPLIAIVSILVVGLLMEVVARKLYNESPTAQNCLIVNDPPNTVRGKPNSVCVEKSRESGWVEYRFNDRGHRAGGPYEPKPSGTYRIVLVGSSLAEGWTVPQDQSFAALLPGLLDKATGKKIEIYNEGVESGAASNTAYHVEDALAAEPDMILWPLTPWDVLNSKPETAFQMVAAASSHVSGKAKKPHGLAELFHKYTTGNALIESLDHHFISFFMLQHLLYKSGSIYLAHSVSGTDEYSPSIQAEPSEAWQAKLQLLDQNVAEMAAKAKAAGVPVVVMALPRHAQAVLISSGTWPSNLNPYSFGDQVKAIVEKHGGIYVDVLHDFRNLPDIHQGFYPVDQHLNPAGQAMFASVMAKELTNGSVAALDAQGSAATGTEKQ